MRVALEELFIDGVESNASLVRELVADPEIRKQGGYNIHCLENKLAR